MDGMLNGDEQNFIIKHLATKHSKLETPPEMNFSVLKTHQDALSRVIQEAVLIDCDADMNSKSKWRLNSKPKLVIEKMNKQKEKDELEMAIENRKQQKLINAVIIRAGKHKDEIMKQREQQIDIDEKTNDEHYGCK